MIENIRKWEYITAGSLMVAGLVLIIVLLLFAPHASAVSLEQIIEFQPQELPVNSIYVSTTNVTPAITIGYGTWELVAVANVNTTGGNQYDYLWKA
jgi:hypothetical protein